MPASGGQKLIDLDVRLSARDVLRMMGCREESALREEIRGLTAKVLQQARSMIQPRCVYKVCPVLRMTDTELRLEGCPAIHGPITGFLRPSKRVVTFVVTIGGEVEKRASQLMQNGEMLEGYVWHAIGSAAADEACDVLVQDLLAHEATAEEGVTLPLSPGYCGVGLEQQQAIFTIVDGGSIGVTLHPSMIMEPVKSVSGLLGIGPRDEIDTEAVPCNYCELTTCAMRRDSINPRLGRAS